MSRYASRMALAGMRFAAKAIKPKTLRKTVIRISHWSVTTQFSVQLFRSGFLFARA